jgi:hypothetical protein
MKHAIHNRLHMMEVLVFDWKGDDKVCFILLVAFFSLGKEDNFQSV